MKPKFPKQKQPHPTPITLTITALTHDGRGVATYDETQGDKAGKKVFVSFALPDETVQATLTHSKKSFDEADTAHLISPSPHRTAPICRHFGVCGGCTLQHFDVDEQLKHKQSVLQNHLTKAGLAPDVWLTPIIGERTHYRTKARLGVRYLPKADKLIVGFRERASNFLTDIDTCPILDKAVNDTLPNLKATLSALKGKNDITHLEIAVGENMGQSDLPRVALIVRHVKPLSSKDTAQLIGFGKSVHWQIFLQPHGADSIHRIDETDTTKLPMSHTTPPTGGLFYQLPDFGLTLQSSPTDFTQVNLSVNRQMVKLACDLLDLQQGERVLDLFCGLGNFSLAMAKLVGDTGRVVGVEGSSDMVERAKMNATDNGLANTTFYAQDLTQDFSGETWVGEVDALLIDPPRTGAWEVMNYLGKFNASRIVYVSCDPATLARDSIRLAEQGYRLTHAGVMDMFCHTGHVESIARFERV
ncbi:MAG: 23S rRNA (uracil(1939)-C(5))-methyltransferase RlmD [Moraxella sp.]|uniref:23S rRNA (uracil(1939)-C(5))-methyltransferase RlmD n=1 Tax=Moraxella sp. TaxID=479 RepID=UPI0026DAED84|nr:23S rRNA (uracil(1939)-C(5))-methyltransferase RlmD [Moraxella sp.]MDO4450552.1 23S rRNA (uracil(1939)-C(5))-methyltransferase RlmD [Moraxella sp.]